MDAAELDIHRRNTSAFIDVKPSVISLTPDARVRTAGGGWKYDEGVLRAPQKFRIIELGGNQSIPVVTLTDGQQREATFWLLGEHDAIVERDDFWVAEDGREWRIGDVVRTNEYEMRALVVERGK